MGSVGQNDSNMGVKRSRLRLPGVASHALCVAFLFAFPASANYQLRDFGFGSGGEDGMASANYGMEGMTGETGVGNLVGSNYGLGAGLSYVQQAGVPAAPTFDNPSDYYDRLRLILNSGGNPSDAAFAVAISDDNWTTTRYVQSDMTVGGVLGSEDYRTYASWGGVSGGSVIGLSPNTTYKIKVKAIHGRFTETGYGPEASATTSVPKLSFDIDVSASDTETSPPFSVSFGSLVAGTVTDSPVKVWIDFATNGNSGGKVFVSGQNGGLQSTHMGSLIATTTGKTVTITTNANAGWIAWVKSANAALSSASISKTIATAGSVDNSPSDLASTTGYVLDVDVTTDSGTGTGTVSQAADYGAEYNGTNTTSGGTLSTTFQPIAACSGTTGGDVLTLTERAKITAVQEAATDYTDTLTVVAAGRF